MSLVIKRISKEVAATTEDCETYVVPDGKKATVIKFFGEAAYDKDVVAKLVWDYGEPGEDEIWTVKGAGQMPFQHTVTGNGAKKLGLCLDNADTGPVFMSGYMLINVED